MVPYFSFQDETERREMGVKPWERRWRPRVFSKVLRGGQGSAVHVAIFSSIGDLVHVI